ncbi:hypothetical protein D9M68_633040 [compost metagenome]
MRFFELCHLYGIQLGKENTFFHLQQAAAFANKDRCLNIIRDLRNALYHVADQAGTLNRIFSGLGQQHIRLVQNKILPVFFNISFKGSGAHFMHIGVGVVAIGERNHFYIQPFLKDHVKPPQRSFNTRCIAIVKYGNVLGKP